MRYGYARVSSRTQNEQRQRDAFRREGIEDRYILVDKESGGTFDRKNYNLLVGTEKTAPLLRKDDCLVIVDLERLGRDYDEIKTNWDLITRTIGADIKVLDIPLLDTCVATDTLDKKFIRDLVFQILSYYAEKERLNIRERQRQGIESAKRLGKRFGRPPAEYPDNWKVIYDSWNIGKITAKKAMEDTGLKRSTFYKLVEQWETENNLVRPSIVRNRIFSESQGGIEDGEKDKN